MKKIYKIFLFSFLTLNCELFLTVKLYAQSPQKFNYQGIARDSVGVVLKNQTLGYKISILQGSPTGTAVYAETHSTTSDNNGVFSLEVGGGTVVSGNFSSIGWGSNSHFVKTEMDATGGTNYQFIGTTQLLSVPYALHSQTSNGPWINTGSGISYGAGSVGLGTFAPDSSSILDINSLTKGILIPRTDTNMISNPAMGLLIYQITDKVFYSFNGSSWQPLNPPSWINGFLNMQVFNTSSSFTVPAGVTKIMVEVWGGGGGGGFNTNSFSGGGGGYGKGIFTVSAGTTHTVTIGSGGSGSTANGSDGGNSSFGSLISASGGKGGYTGGMIGGTSTASLNINGSAGISVTNDFSPGGNSPNGGSGGWPQAQGIAPGGGGGGGGCSGSCAGGNGASGRIVVWW